MADGGTVRRRHELDRRLGQAGALEAGDERRMDRQRRVEAFRSGAQDRRVAGLHRQRAGVGGHVGPAFVDDADDAERHAHALKAQAVRPRPFGQHRADGIGQRGNLLDALGGRFDARLVEQQTIDERGRPSGGARGFQVLGIGGEDGRCRPTQRIGSRAQRLRLRLRRRQGQRMRRGAGAPADGQHGLLGRCAALVDALGLVHALITSGARPCRRDGSAHRSATRPI